MTSTAPSPAQAPLRGDRLLDSLTEEQRAAVESPARVTLVNAPPGSGKTRCLAARIVWDVRLGARKPHEVLALTFTRSAAAEVRARTVDSLGEESARDLGVRTFHSAALALLRIDARLGGAVTALPEAFSVAADHEVEREVRALYEGPRRRPETAGVTRSDLWDALRAYAASGIRPERKVARVFDVLNRRLAEAGLVAAERLVPLALRVIAEAQYGAIQTEQAGEEVRKWLEGWRSILVDEAHDCTPVEATLVGALVGPLHEGRTLWAVQDSRQAIFGWRGADSFALGREAERVAVQEAGGGARRVLLTRTFRFGPAIAERAQDALGSSNPGVRFDGAADVESHLESVEVGPRGVSPEEGVSFALGQAEPGSCAVLCRTNHECEQVASLHPTRLEPVGPRVERTSRLWPLWAVLRLMVNPADKAAAHEALALSPSGDDPLLFRDVQARAGLDRSWWEQYRADRKAGLIGDDRAPALLEVAREAVGRDATAGEVARAVDLAMEWDDALAKRGERLWDLVRHMGLDGAPLAEALDALLHTPDQDLIRDVEARGRIPVLTIHAAKGREWSRVVLVQREGWPDRERDPEERRLAFVAMTRARRVLATVRVTLQGGPRG